ncbi:MAG: lytic transglycosylase domain-containing protein [Verrucomicrobiae bacterium]|nr:lytic transglycosylase domain-containing protein [Verrucomicrobiae bacterium]
MRRFTGAVWFGLLLGLFILGVPLWRMRQSSLRESRFDALILWAAAENGVDPALVKAVAWRESKFDPAVRGRNGEIGLMQVMPTPANEWAAAHGGREMDPSRLFDPLTNLRVGSWHLTRALQNWAHAADPVPLALAQYNAGRGNLLKWVDAASMGDGEYFVCERIQFASTRSYVRDILRQCRTYRQRGEF